MAEEGIRKFRSQQLNGWFYENSQLTLLPATLVSKLMSKVSVRLIQVHNYKQVCSKSNFA